MEKECRNCFWWIPNAPFVDRDGHGRCKRMPPTALDYTFSAFPQLHMNESCGEWKNKVESERWKTQ